MLQRRPITEPGPVSHTAFSAPPREPGAQERAASPPVREAVLAVRAACLAPLPGGLLLLSAPGTHDGEAVLDAALGVAAPTRVVHLGGHPSVATEPYGALLGWLEGPEGLDVASVLSQMRGAWCGEDPVVVVVRRVGCLDPGTVHVLCQLSAAQELRLVVLAGGWKEVPLGLRMLQRAGWLELHRLRALSPPEVADRVRQQCGLGLSASALEALWRLSAGSGEWLSELVPALLSSGKLREYGGVLGLAAGPWTGSLRLSQAVDRHVAALGPAARRALEAWVGAGTAPTARELGGPVWAELVSAGFVPESGPGHRQLAVLLRVSRGAGPGLAAVADPLPDGVGSRAGAAWPTAARQEAAGQESAGQAPVVEPAAVRAPAGPPAAHWSGHDGRSQDPGLFLPGDNAGRLDLEERLAAALQSGDLSGLAKLVTRSEPTVAGTEASALCAVLLAALRGRRAEAAHELRPILAQLHVGGTRALLRRAERLLLALEGPRGATGRHPAGDHAAGSQPGFPTFAPAVELELAPLDHIPPEPVLTGRATQDDAPQNSVPQDAALRAGRVDRTLGWAMELLIAALQERMEPRRLRALERLGAQAPELFDAAAARGGVLTVRMLHADRRAAGQLVAAERSRSQAVSQAALLGLGSPEPSELAGAVALFAGALHRGDEEGAYAGALALRAAGVTLGADGVGRGALRALPAGMVRRLATSEPSQGDSVRAIPAFAGIRFLTPRELLVVSEVCAGRGNPAIALRLGISVRTVEGHLHQVYSKLGLEHRQALAELVSAARPLPQRTGP